MCIFNKTIKKTLEKLWIVKRKWGVIINTQGNCVNNMRNSAQKWTNQESGEKDELFEKITKKSCVFTHAVAGSYLYVGI